MATLTVYIVVFSLVLTILASLVAFFNSNLSNIDYNSASAEEFNKFNTYFITDVKKSRYANVSKNYGNQLGDYRIVLAETEEDFESNKYIAVYYYIVKDRAIYRGNVKIARNIVVFTAVPVDKKVDPNGKSSVKVTIGAGTSASKPNFGKTIRYVLKYW